MSLFTKLNEAINIYPSEYVKMIINPLKLRGETEVESQIKAFERRVTL